MVKSKPHILVISRTPADEEYDEEVDYEIEHLADCAQEVWSDDLQGYKLYMHVCDLGTHLSWVGLDGLTWPASLGVEGTSWKDLPEGRYVIQTWSLYDSLYGEWEDGIEILGREGDVVVAT